MQLNKIFAIAALALATVFSACTDHERIFTTAACQDAASSYYGEWTKLAVATGEVVTTSGVVTITEHVDENGDITPFIANIVAASEGSEDRTDVCNIAHANDGFVFYNNVGTVFGAKFSGDIDAAGNLEMQYTVEEQAGRSKKVFKYNFVGSKTHPVD